MMKSPSPIEPVARTSPPDATRTRIREHLLAGWAGLAFIVVTGLLLEGLHALKVDAYLLPSNETRRMMWRLAHSHGGLLCLLQLGFAGTLALVPQPVAGSRRLHVATVLIPGGFLLGGFGAQGGDPSLGVLLVPVGAAALLSTIWTLCRGVLAHRA